MIQPTNTQLPIPQQGGANVVSINIYNPQAYGTTPQQAPYDYTNSVYNVPQNSVYNQGVQYVPQQVVAQPAQTYVQAPIQQPIVAAIPAPQMMPTSVLEQPPVQEAVPSKVAENVEINNEPSKTTAKVDTDSLINNLKSTDAKVREAAINKLAEYLVNIKGLKVNGITNKPNGSS